MSKTSTQSLVGLLALTTCVLVNGCGQASQTGGGATKKMGHTVYAIKDIKAGTPISKELVEDKEVPLGSVPGDVAQFADVVKSTAAADIASGHVVSVEDIGKELTDDMVKRCTVPAVDPSDIRQMYPVIYASKEIEKNGPFTSENVSTTQLPGGTIPMDAVTSSKLVEGRKAKFAIRKNQLIMMHNLVPSE